MHPLFVELFIDTHDEQLAEDDERRARTARTARTARRARARPRRLRAERRPPRR
jgi:hypothetical protein